MVVDMVLDMPAFSINAYYFRDRRHKTPEARAWEQQFQNILDSDYKILTDFAHMAKDGATVGVEICVEYPPHIFWNKAGQISSRTFDVTNTEKAIIDQLFNYMGLNDKIVTRLVSTKKAGPRNAIKVRLELNPL